MEERSYSLYSAGTRTAIKVLAAIFVIFPVIAGITLGILRGPINSLFGLVAAMLGATFVWCLAHLSRSAKLCISDSGLVETAMWSKPTSVTWDGIRNVSTREQRLSLSRSRETILTITGSQGEAVVVSSTVPDWNEIILILKDRLPRHQRDTFYRE